MADYLIKQAAGGSFSVEAISQRAQERGGMSTKGLSSVFRTVHEALHFVKAGKIDGFSFEETGLRLLKTEHLRHFFENEKKDYEVKKRYVSDPMATRCDFAKGVDHFMLDIPANLLADYDVPEIVTKLIEASWWTVLQSWPAPGIVTFSSLGFSLSKAA